MEQAGLGERPIRISLSHLLNQPATNTPVPTNKSIGYTGPPKESAPKSDIGNLYFTR
jgi:hypothetical protein